MFRNCLKVFLESWSLCGQGICGPAWKEPQDLMLQETFTVPVGELCGIYVHSSLQNDRGIMYQTYGCYTDPIVKDENVVCFPGQARVGHEPFQEDREDLPEEGLNYFCIYFG